MNITVQQFNAVVEGAKVHRQLLQDQVKEKSARIEAMEKELMTSWESNQRAFAVLNKAEEVIEKAAILADGGGIDLLNIDHVEGANCLLKAIMQLRSRASTAELELAQLKSPAPKRHRGKKKT